MSITTDSEYLRNAFVDGWLTKWQQNKWRTSSKKPVANEDLWRTLLDLVSQHQVEWRWVKGHATDGMNIRCDELAVRAREGIAAVLSASNTRQRA